MEMVFFGVFSKFFQVFLVFFSSFPGFFSLGSCAVCGGVFSRVFSIFLDFGFFSIGIPAWSESISC